ncbi:MAG TPA: NHLP-related RiPP peptide [Rhodanobacteraceae bacterium]|jgi:putative modified peptide|nr:NHLP-related RiPP peptide [Rhodanobacteraceae bacterium]
MIKGKVSSETVGRILDRLSQDHDFREHFIGDPAGALKPFGIEVDASKVPAVRRLPSKDEIAKVRDKAKGIDDPITKVGLAVFLLK